MPEPAIASDGRRDLRLDLFRGLANWAIFLDHVPNNAVAWVTAKNYGFSDAAELFVFVSGYTAAFVYARFMLAQGFVASSVALLGRAWQIYVAHILLFVLYVVTIGYVAQRYGHAHLLDEFNIRFLIADPVEFLKHGLLLEFKPLNLDVLPLYIALMAGFPPVLWLLLRYPNGTLIGSLALYVMARTFDWNLPGYPGGSWYFNPFAWQLLFVAGAWIAVGGALRLRRLLDSPLALIVASAFLISAAMVSVATRTGFDAWLPAELVAAFVPNDKTNLAPYRLVHFLALALVVSRLLPRNSPVLVWPVWQPVLICGRRSLEVFCAGVFLAFVAHFLIELVSNSLGFQILVSAGGIAALTALAYLRTWAKGLRKRGFQGQASDVNVAKVRSLAGTIATAGLATLLAATLASGSADARAGFATENPWAPEHITALPPDIQRLVAGRARACGGAAAAAHYFSVSIEAEGYRFVSLHFEDFACRNRAAICSAEGCLHEVYLETRGRHRLVFRVHAQDLKMTNVGAAGIEVSGLQSRHYFRWDGQRFVPMPYTKEGR